MPGTRLSYVYTTKAEMQRLLGERGVALRTDDLSPTALDEYFVELAEDASDIINQYCESFYEKVDLASSRWVRIRATWIGCYLLSQRRGNPSLLTGRYQEILEELERIRLGVIEIPGMAKRGDFMPCASNLTVDMNYSVQNVRVVSQTSTGPNYPEQHVASMRPFDWL